MGDAGLGFGPRGPRSSFLDSSVHLTDASWGAPTVGQALGTQQGTKQATPPGPRVTRRDRREKGQINVRWEVLGRRVGQERGRVLNRGVREWLVMMGERRPEGSG